MNSYCNQPLFTVEQIELIRRLRNSGITKQQVSDAFDSLSRIDHELGSLYAVQQSATKRQRGRPEECPDATAFCSVVDGSGGKKLRAEDDGCHGDDAEGAPLGLVVASGIDEDLKTRLDEFMRIPPGRRLEDIQSIISGTRITPSAIASKTGLPVPTISHYLEGGTTEISSNQRRSIYIWYLRMLQQSGSAGYTITTSNQKIMVRMSGAVVKSPSQPVMQILPNPEDSNDTGVSDDVHEDLTMNGNLAFLQSLPGVAPRRERFTFVKQHLDVLEECFLDDQYPCTEIREQIAVRCNTAIMELTSRELLDRERVNVGIVSNWYNNKRKEVKRLAKEEKMGCSDVAGPNKFNKYTQETGGFPLSRPNGSAVNGQSSSDLAVINKMLSAWHEDAQSVKIKQEPADDSDEGAS